MFPYRLALPALCLSLIMPFALPVLAGDTQPETEPAAKPAVRDPLPERSQEDAAALERQLPVHEQQQLQAPNDSFLALWKPANSSAPEGAVIIVPGAGETADWPLTVGPLRNKLPDANWASLSLSLPDMQSEASQAREAEPEKPPTAIATDSSSKAASTTAKPAAARQLFNKVIMRHPPSQAHGGTTPAQPPAATPFPVIVSGSDFDEGWWAGKVSRFEKPRLLTTSVASDEIYALTYPMTNSAGADATEVTVRGKPFDLTAVARENVARFEVK